jgi:hypothetical protein
MADAIEMHLEALRSRYDPSAGDLLLLEHRVDLGPWGPPAPMFGTCDVLIYKPTARRLHLLDFKFGAGVTVEAERNDQLVCYAAGATHAVPGPVTEIELVIVQPRGHHPAGPVRREMIDAPELIERVADLLDDAKRALEPDAPLNPGSWCRFCPAAPTCPALRAHALEVAQVEFAETGLPVVPPVPAQLEADELGRLLDASGVVETWIRALRTHAHDRLECGLEIPGWKLVEKRAMRRWRDEAEAAAQLEALGLEPDDIFARTLRSPAQVEKRLGRKRKNEIADLVIAESFGSTLAPVTAYRPALPRTDFFGLLEAPPQSRETANTEEPSWRAF